MVGDGMMIIGSNMERGKRWLPVPWTAVACGCSAGRVSWGGKECQLKMTMQDFGSLSLFIFWCLEWRKHRKNKAPFFFSVFVPVVVVSCSIKVGRIRWNLILCYKVYKSISLFHNCICCSMNVNFNFLINTITYETNIE